MQNSTPAIKPISFTGVILVTSLLWTATLGGLFAWNLRNEIRNSEEVAHSQTKAFFEQFLMTRFWNAIHRGVYVPVTEETPPNPFLEDDPLRDLETTNGIRLTKLNPAYMTRQISEVARERSEVRFHLTAIDPINPVNRADPWEEKALRETSRHSDYFELVTTEEGDREYRYVSKMYVEEPCLECHERYGDRLGEPCGGISVAIPAEPILRARDAKILHLGGSYLLVWLIGLTAVIGCGRRMQRKDRERTAIIRELQESREEVRQLSGMLPICCSCKNIRNDEGYWQRVEQYIGEHADIEFTHGLCPDCAKKLYPEFYREEGEHSSGNKKPEDGQ
ncbi:MAG: hypothetical protein Kow0089_22970 [Desulfobulbaceae bacterium]